MKVLIKVLYIVSIYALHSSVYSQRSFHVNIEDGLSTNNLTDLFFDSQDNLWIASYNGLMKHEGGRITTYGQKNINQHYNLSSLEMHSVVEDKCGLIWIATTNGVNILHPTNNIIDKINIQSDKSGSTFVGYIYWIWQDNEEFIWISTDIGLYKIDNNNYHVEKIKFTNDMTGLPYQIVSYNGGISDQYRLWMMTNGGLVFYDYITKEFHHSQHNPKKYKALDWSNTMSGNQSDLKMDSLGNLWFIHHAEYLVKFNPTANEIDTFRLHLPKGTWKCCMSMEIDNKGNVWIGTRHGGILIFDPASKTFRTHMYDGMNSLIQSNYIYALAKDDKGLMFISTSNGLDIIDYYNYSIKEITLSEEPRFTNLKYESGDISYDGTNQQVYIPFYFYGFISYHHDSNRIMSEEFEGGTPMVFSRQSELTISQKNGLKLYDYKKNNSQLESHLKSTKSDSSYIIYYYPIDAHEWIIKRNKGNIYLYHLDSIKTIKSIGFKPNLCLSKDSTSIWYINKDMNLASYHLSTHTIDETNIQHKLRKMKVSFANPRHIADDGEAVWITSQNGILRYIYGMDSLISYDIKDGLLHGFTFGVVADHDDQIWVASLGGINLFDRKTNTFQTILPLEETSYMDAFGHTICTDEGILYFHLGNKLYRIDPVRFPSKSPPKKLAFSSIHVNDQFYLENDAKLMGLSATQNKIQIRFALKDFLFPSLANYKYQLNDDAWKDIGNETNLMFNSLKSGKYLLKISASDYNNVSAENILVLKFKINPPFYQTWWFSLLILLIATVILYYWYQSKLKVVMQRNKISLQMAELKATAIKAQMNPHFIFNSLNSIQECVINGETDKAYDYITLFSKFLRSVLNYSNKNNITISEDINLIKIYLQLESFRFKQVIILHENYSNTIEPDLDTVPAMILQPLIENAIWHGLRNKEGEKNIWINFTDYATYLEIQVIDNGVGFTSHKIKKTHSYESMGLHLVKERIYTQWSDDKRPEEHFTIENLHNQCIYKGTKVKILLPKISNLLNNK